MRSDRADRVRQVATETLPSRSGGLIDEWHVILLKALGGK